jgi:hypothetical protein
MHHNPQAPRHEPIHWHSAFSQAIRAELLDYSRHLLFSDEFQLSSEPLRIDTLIIHKNPDISIPRAIARIFRRINICEYKSPHHSFSVRDFFKVCAYAFLYAATIPGVDIADISLTLIGSKYPRKLISYFTRERQCRVEEMGKGIYRVMGDYLPVQLIETKKLETEPGFPLGNRLLKDLGRGLERGEVSTILKRSRELARETPLDAYVYAVMQGNAKAFEEVIGMREDTVTVEEVLMRTGILPKWINRGREDVARNLLKKGWSIEETAETAELDIERVRALSVSLDGGD